MPELSARTRREDPVKDRTMILVVFVVLAGEERFFETDGDASTRLDD
jgi:hypothetical protein